MSVVASGSSQPGAGHAEDPSGPVGGRHFRNVLGHFPTGVVIITARGADGQAVGMAVGSFTSVSLDPPLVAFLPAKTSSTWPRVQEAGSFCANILGFEHKELVRRFASSGGDKFAGLDWRPGPSGHPLLPGVPAWIDCAVENVMDAGDHWIVLGRVLALAADHSHRNPLVFSYGAFGQFQAVSGTALADTWDSSDSHSWWWW